jgi:hypothetical protein
MKCQKADAILVGTILALLLLSGPVLNAQEVLRGSIRIDLEQMYGPNIYTPYPLDAETVRFQALEEARLFYSAMIYGWSFHYEVGEQARGIAEELELELQGEVDFGDPALFATDAEFRDMFFSLWTDYRLSDIQKRRVGMWRASQVRNLQARGRDPLGDSITGMEWPAIKRKTLEDAARSGLRTVLRGTERNRPKTVQGYIALAEFPRYYFDEGRLAVSARFRVDIREIVPFGAY